MGRLAGLIVVLLLGTGPAFADYCGEREASTIFSCAIEGSSRSVHVCRHEGDGIQYVYGRPGAEPELVLNRRPQELIYTPWNGVGRAIWASLGIPNGEYLYEVSFSYDKFDQVESGTLLVFRRTDIVATLTCRPGTLVHDLSDRADLFPN
ncbi:MAG: hypothetical protein AAGK00_10585 [Pseudomonadota bacterium]